MPQARWRRRHKLRGLHAWRQRFRCFYCDKYTPGPQRTLEHLIPQSQGGDDSKENTAMACKDCNNRRHGTPVEEHKRAMREAKADD